MQELTGATRSLANGKAVGPDGVSVELFETTLNGDPALRRRLLDIVACIWRGDEVPQQCKYAIIIVPHKKKDWTECGIYRGISLVAYAGKILLKIIARCFSGYCERVGIPAKKQSGSRPNRSITDMMLVVRRLDELARKKQIPMYALFTLPKRTTPSTEPSSGQYSPVLACHIISSRPFVNSTMACEYACGSTTRYGRGDLLWDRAFAKGTCSHPSCSLSSSQRL